MSRRRQYKENNPELTLHPYFTRKSSRSHSLPPGQPDSNTADSSKGSRDVVGSASDKSSKSDSGTISLADVRELISEMTKKLLDKFQTLENKKGGVERKFIDFEKKINDLSETVQCSVQKVTEIESNMKEKINGFENSLQYHSARE